MRRTTFVLLAFLSAIITYGQIVSDKGQDVTKGTVRIKIETTLGDIVVRLYDATPIHRDNFVKLVKEGYYDGTLFHRVIKNFMIQGGDPNSKSAPADKPLGGGSTDYTLEPEFRAGLYHKRGALAAAREGDKTNPERRSSGSQFYIVWGRTFSPRQIEYLTDKMKAERPESGGWTEEQQNIYATVGGSPHLDGQYTVFGEVEEGLGVVEKIQSTPTGPGDRPIENIEVKMMLIE
jgi:peptidyl-prolyl cis-trans isomerase B (cyclophilin B)